MRYTDEDIEFANLVLTDRKNLDDEKVEEWMKDSEHVRLLKEFTTVYQRRMNINFNWDKKEEFARLENTILERKSRRMMILRWSVAASVILLVGLFLGRAVNEWRDLDEVRVLAETGRIVPGGKAELILSTGERVALNQQSVSIEGMNETGIQNDSVVGLNYTMAKVQGEEIVYNTMQIPVGGFYQLKLADGTKVWMNSLTQLRFPVTFAGEERKVYLTGEAYFEVARDSVHPFIVATDEGMEVKVYGTEFNVATYHKGTIKTTLVNGEVGIWVKATGEEVKLMPNQVALFTVATQSVEVENVDPYGAVAWKDGKFVFEDEPIEEIMERLSRWYDVKVFYANESIKKHTFTGIITRFADISDVLHLMEETAVVEFNIQGNIITVK
ncbi:FecR family protein [Butyricimonas paravirosa]